MRFSLVRVLPTALESLSPKDCYSLGEIGCVRDLIQLAATKNQDSICLGFVEGEKLLGIAGSYRIWDGVSQAWAVFDQGVDAYPIALREVCVSLIEFARARQELRRMSLNVRAGFQKGERFAESLGFEKEGYLSKYLPGGGDAILYARLF